MSEPSYREQLRMRLEAGMTRTAGPSQVGPVERSGTQPASEKAVEAIPQPVGAASSLAGAGQRLVRGRHPALWRELGGRHL